MAQAYPQTVEIEAANVPSANASSPNISSPTNSSLDAQPELDTTLRATIEALTGLDANRLEALVRGCERLTRVTTHAEASRAVVAHRVLGCLLEQTRRNLQLLARITERGAEEYSRPACTRL